MRELHDDVIKIVFVRSEENEADILTKNSTRKEFENHVPKLVEEVPKNLNPSRLEGREKNKKYNKGHKMDGKWRIVEDEYEVEKKKNRCESVRKTEDEWTKDNLKIK